MKSEWPTKNFGDLVDFVTEKSNANFVKINSYISTENMEPNFGGVKNAKTLPLSGSIGKFRFSDTLFSNIRTYFKKVWLAEFDGHCSNDVLIFRSKNNSTLNPNFLFNLCRWEKFTELSVRTSKGSKMPRGDTHALKKFEFKLPPIDYQIETTEILNYLDDRITLLRETNTTLEAIAQALFKSWFIDFDPVHAKMQGQNPEGMDEATAALFPDSFDETESGPVPKGWRNKIMSDISTVGIGKTPPRKEQQWFSETSSDIRWVSIRDMGSYGVYALQTNEFLTREAVEKFNIRVIPNNTTLMSFKMTIGRVAITEGAITTNEAIAHFKLDGQSFITSEYIYLHLKQFNFSTLSSTSSIADAVNSKGVREIPILEPSKNVALAFQEKINHIFERIKTSELQIINFINIRDELLPKLISGQLKVPEVN